MVIPSLKINTHTDTHTQPYTDTDTPSSNHIILTPDASEALDKLGTFLAFVCDYLQCGPKFLVVVGKPLQERHALDQLMLLPRLRKAHKVRSVSGWATMPTTGAARGAHLLVCEMRFVFLLLWR